MDIQEVDNAPSLNTTSTLTAQASSLQRLDDKLATGMTITDVANVRWLTSMEVLTYLDMAQASNFVDYPLMKAPPASPPTTGTLILYNSVETPNYAEDGIEWKSDPGIKWKSIERVLARYGDSQSDSDSATGGGTDGGSQISGLGMPGPGSGGPGGSSSSSSALASGASAEYLSCATRNSFHRREYRGPNNLVLLHYLDSVRALRMTSELVDRIVLLSADADADLPPVAGGAANPSQSKSSSSSGGKRSTASGIGADNQQDLGDTMNILMEMVDEHDAEGTTVAEAVDEHVLKAANDAAYNAVMKHIAPSEAMGVVDAIEMAMEDDILINEEELAEIEDVTALEIDEAIDQVLSGGPASANGDGDVMENGENKEGSSKRSVSSSSGSGETKTKGAAEIIEDRILNSVEEVLPDDLRLKLINTTEVMLDAAGVNLKSKKGSKSDRKNELLGNAGFAMPSQSALGGSSPSAPGSTEVVGHALPEIIDVTPDFHVMGYQPLTATGAKRKGPKLHQHSIVLSTKSPIPGLPPYVDQYYVWERFAAFVDFQEVADDPLVRNVSFNRMTTLTPFSYKVKMPTDIPNYSVRHIVVVGVLLPKDHRVKRNLRGIELALKLTLQTEWSAAADLVGAYAYQQSKGDAPWIKGIKRPIFIAPCGGTRMQLLTQISKIKFTMYPASSLPQSLTSALSSSAPNFVQRVAIDATDTSNLASESGQETKRKRENFFEEWAATPGIDADMTTAEVDRHRKVRFVERISNAIVETKGESEVLPNLDTSGSETKLDGVPVEDMPEEDVDNLLGQVLMRFVEVCLQRCTTKEELSGEINWSGYAGLSLLHHACFYNFMALITLLLNNGADIDIKSAEGDLTPIHFAASAGHKEVAEVLIRKGCNPCAVDINGETPADHARKGGHVELAAMLSAYNEQAGIEGNSNDMDVSTAKTSDVFLQSAFKELPLKDKLGLNLFVDRSKAAPVAFVRKASSAAMMTDGEGDYLENAAFSFISSEDRIKLREAMSLASEMDLKEMNIKAEHQDVRRYLRQSNYEAISAASQALEKAKRKEAAILDKASSNSDDPSKMQLSRALAMLVLRKNMPKEP